MGCCLEGILKTKKGRTPFIPLDASEFLFNKVHRVCNSTFNTYSRIDENDKKKEESIVISRKPSIYNEVDEKRRKE